MRHEIRVISAHREPDTVAEYARTARLRGLRVVIAGRRPPERAWLQDASDESAVERRRRTR